MCVGCSKAGHQSLRSEQFAGSSEGNAWGSLILWYVPSCGNQKGKQVSKMTSSTLKSGQTQVIAFFPTELVAHTISNCTENNPINLCTPWEYCPPEPLSASYD